MKRLVHSGKTKAAPYLFPAVSNRAPPTRPASSAASADQAKEAEKNSTKADSPPPHKAGHHKTQAQLDEELRQKLEDASGEGGAAGMEFENGKAVSMKRGVRDNMFRYI